MPVAQKKKLRLIMKERRNLLSHQQADASEKVKSHFFNFFKFPPQSIIGGYWPIGSELDIRPLLNGLIEKGFRCALPRIAAKGLEFRLWEPSIQLIKGMFQILEPPSTCPIVIPEVLLVPLLAFDRQCHRLGYGQGHYDWFLHYHKMLTIGVGFAGQEVEMIPQQPHDCRLDYILTEVGIVSRNL